MDKTFHRWSDRSVCVDKDWFGSIWCGERQIDNWASQCDTQVCQGCLHQGQCWDDQLVFSFVRVTGCLELQHCANAAGVPADSKGEPGCRERGRHWWHKAPGNFCLLTILTLLLRFCWERNPSGVLPTWTFPDPLGEERTWDLVLARSSSVHRGGSLFPYYLIHRGT